MARTQIDRPFRLKSSLGDDVLLLESFDGVERISTPFRYIFTALAVDPSIDMKGLLKKPLVLSIVQTDKSERHIHGNISRMKLLGEGDDGLTAYEIEMAPWLWFLNLFSDSRIFQNKTVPEIVQQVFSDRGFSDYRVSTQGSYQPLDYCVQYRETDFNFISRLLEQEGIFYYFEHTLDKHTLVLTDVKEALTTCPHKEEAHFMPSSGGLLADDTVNTLETEAHVYTGTASLRDYDFEKPSTDLSAALSGNEPGSGGEFYDYPGKYVAHGEGERYARIRLEEHEVRLVTLSAQTNCMGLECGYKFTLKDHFRDDANIEYAIVALSQSGRNTSYRANPDPTAFSYSNNIEAIPASVPFRPPRIARKPSIDGVQTAVVVGKAGEEIWTDQYGRVKVQFYWDRQGSDDENSSCWVRVSHAWAGKMWGAIYTPRIGQEVIVSFLEGDPDHPIITGRVYNADQMPPYALPDEQTKSTLKSMTSKGGNGFNELRFEDKAGSEQIFLHGEKDLDIRIKNDRKEWIGANRHLYVKTDKFEKVDGNEHSHIQGNRNEKIEGDHSQEITGTQGIKITGAHSLSVTGNVTETFDGNQSTAVTQNLYLKGLQIVIEAQVGLTLKVGGSFVTIDPSGVAVMGPIIQLNSAGAALSGSPGSAASLTAPTDPKDADTADPGGNTSAASNNVVPPKSLTLTNVSPAVPAADLAEEPGRQAPAAAGGAGGSPSQSEVATFPKDVDPAAVADTLKAAAQDGHPFCEECLKAQQQPPPEPEPEPEPVSSGT